MAGKSVRCKACNTIFRVAEPESAAPEPGDLDFDALERSFTGEAVDTTTGRPLVDAKGKVSIKRSSDVSDVALAGESAAAIRSNFRYRFPMAKQIDQFLPWVLLVGSLALLFNWCRSINDPGLTGIIDAPPTNVALSRFFLLLAGYVIIIFPAAHIAMHSVSRKLRFSMPRAAAWRTFTGFMPLLLLGAGLYMLSGGAFFGLVAGLILGTLVSVGAITLLYRLFPNEMPMVAAYSAGGALLGFTFTAAALFAINHVSLAIANMSKKEPELFVSPIALGLKWQEKPIKLASTSPRPSNPAANETRTPANVPTTQDTAAANPTPSLLQPMPVPSPTSTDAKPLASKLEVTPVTPGFGVVVTPPVESKVVAAIRDAGSMEIFNTESWIRTSNSLEFQRSDWSIAPNTTGDVAVRVVRTPNYRIESLPLIRGKAPAPILLEGSNDRTILGFVDERTLLVLRHEHSRLALERYDVETSQRLGQHTSFGKTPADQLEVSWAPGCVRMTPNGACVLIAGRAATGDASVGRLALYNSANPGALVSKRDLPINARFDFRPVGLAINNSGRVAMLLNTDNEAYFTTWHMDMLIEGVVHMATSERQIVDRKLGLMSSMRPGDWEDWNYDALTWVSDDAVLLFGTYIVDAKTGRVLGETGVKGVVGQIRESENTVLIVQRENMLRRVLRLTFDVAAIEAARKQ